jgi:signal transduction histidine kinase
MLRTLRGRLLIVALLSVVLTTLVTVGEFALFANPFHNVHQWLAATASMTAGLAVALLLVVLATLIATRPLGRMVQATRELTEGRHPDEAFAELGDDDELREIAASFRTMAMRLREVDSSDRRFLMSISHELRTPLTAITGHTQALLDGFAEDPEARDRSLAVILREASRLDRLVEDIIDLAKLRSNRFTTVVESVYMDELGDHLMAIFRDRHTHSDVEVRGDFDHTLFHSDGHRILQVLRNLVNNALRYADTHVQVKGERVRGRIYLTVFNDGEPIPEEMHERIFEPFVGTKREGGMGLGLAIGRELAWALGGSLRCIPSEAGALFELTLPLEPHGSGR